MLGKKYLYKPKHLIKLNQKIKKSNRQTIWNKIKEKFTIKSN